MSKGRKSQLIGVGIMVVLVALVLIVYGGFSSASEVAYYRDIIVQSLAWIVGVLLLLLIPIFLGYWVYRFIARAIAKIFGSVDYFQFQIPIGILLSLLYGFCSGRFALWLYKTPYESIQELWFKNFALGVIGAVLCFVGYWEAQKSEKLR